MMPAVAALVLAMTFSAERSVQLAAGGRVEVRAGAVPDDPLSPSRAQMALALVPVIGLHVMRPRYELTALYRPRLFWRFPNRLSLSRPLFLNQGSLDHRYLLTSRTAMENRLNVSFGEVDYTLSSIVFDPAQPTVPTDDVTPLFRANASSALAHVISRRTNVGVRLFGTYNTPLNREDAPGFRTSARAELEPFVGYHLDERNEITLLVAGGFSWFSTGLGEESLVGASAAESGASTYAVIAPRGRFRHQFSRQTSGMIGAGLAYLQVIQGSELLGVEEGETEVSPTGEAAVQSQLWRGRGQALYGGVFAEYRWFFDPILGRPVRRVGAGWFGELDLPPRWNVRHALTFFTSVDTDDFEPPNDLLANRRLDQTMVRIDFPVSYQISRYFGLEFGARSNLRGPAIGDGFELDRVEVWAYGALRFVFDPRDSEAGWAQ